MESWDNHSQVEDPLMSHLRLGSSSSWLGRPKEIFPFKSFLLFPKQLSSV